MKRFATKIGILITLLLIAGIAFYWNWHDNHLSDSLTNGTFFKPGLDPEALQRQINIRALSHHMLDFFK